MSHYPEHDKLKAVKDKSQAIGEFLEWLHDDRGMVLAERDERNDLFISPLSIRALLAEFFEIDEQRLDDEKRAMLDEHVSSKGSEL